MVHMHRSWHNPWILLFYVASGNKRYHYADLLLVDMMIFVIIKDNIYLFFKRMSYPYQV